MARQDCDRDSIRIPAHLFVPVSDHQLKVEAARCEAAAWPFAYRRDIYVENTKVGAVLVSHVDDPHSGVVPGAYWLPLDGGPDGSYDSAAFAAWQNAPAAWRKLAKTAV